MTGHIYDTCRKEIFMAEGKETMKSGLVWHMYHDHLVTYCWDYEKRAQSIIAFKPVHEVAERLKRFQLIKGELPEAFRGKRSSVTINELLVEYKDAVIKLHAEECPGCTWNGHRLVFPRHWLRRAWYWLRSWWRVGW